MGNANMGDPVGWIISLLIQTLGIAFVAAVVTVVYHLVF